MQMCSQPVRPVINHLRLSRQPPRFLEGNVDIGRPQTEDMAPRIQVCLNQVGCNYTLHLPQFLYTRPSLTYELKKGLHGHRINTVQRPGSAKNA